MRTRHLVLFLTGTVPYWFLSRVVFCYDEAPWQPVQYDYYHIDLGELASDQDQGFASRSSKLPTPSDAIVDVINNLGIKLLAIHNERNENNIAISPYGAFSVLAALSEGLQGESVHEILHAAHVPYDQQIVRVGLRDIHRHLKSYFIPEEGFLAGLTLNLNNITLKSNYQDVLKFYGFDYGSFNNALYPDPPTTKKSAEGTTLETGLGVSEDSPTVAATTTESPQNTIVEVANRANDDIPTTTEVATTHIPTTTMASVETTTSEPEVIVETTTEVVKTTEAAVTTEAAISSEGTSTPLSVETAPPTESPKDTTTATTVIETLQLNAESQTPSGTTGTSKDTTLARVTSMTSSSAAKIPGGYTSTKQFETTAEYHRTTSSDSETASSNTATPSIISSVGSTGNTVRTTREVTESIQSSIGETSTMIPTRFVTPTTTIYSTESTELQQTTTETPKSTSVQTVEAETTAQPQFTKEVVTTETTFIPDTTTQLLSTSETVSSTKTTESTSELTSPRSTQTILSSETITETTFILTTPTNVQPGITGVKTTPEPTSSSLTTLTTIGQSENSVSTQQDNLETTTPPFFGTTPNFQGTPANQGNFDFNNYNYNENTPVYDDEEVVENTNNNFKRSVRSVADYIISRYLCRIYDDGSQFVPLTQRTQYVPEDSMTFAVYGKYREPVAFMKYDTVLPYFFAPNLNAVALSFPLDSSKYYLLLLLPLRDDGIDQLIYDLRISGSLKYVIENLRLAHVQATIPSFTLKGYVTLTPTLQKLGIHQIFEPRQADFSPMTNSTDIFVTNIEQAVTVTIRNYLDPSAQRYKNYQQYPPITFKADHPFLYFVVDSELHVALMVGKVINPLNSRIS
ncbi:uncharacterized protein Spn85F [Euwallacea similis]|uniref:uncharacterized protein Spn85F n=1 Tax=Euwallacea similis TaxID=1736056 RepID=UPI00344F47F7